MGLQAHHLIHDDDEFLAVGVAIAIGWTDLDVIWVAAHGPSEVYWLCMGARWEQALFVVQFWKKENIGWTLPTDGSNDLAYALDMPSRVFV